MAVIVSDFRQDKGQGQRVKAICSVVVDEWVRINHVRICQLASGKLIVELPKRKVGDHNFQPIVEIVDRDLHQEIIRAVLGAYQRQPQLPASRSPEPNWGKATVGGK